MRISEIYPSIQGEGPRVGVPTLFVRFAGCNLRCPGWPCDTQHAIDPAKYRDEWQTLPVVEVTDRISELCRLGGINNVCLTGGEPFLQNMDELKHLVDELRLRGLNGYGASLEVFTNGTLLWPEWAMWSMNFIMDWKLQGSGEKLSADIMMGNASRLDSKDAIKFTVKDKDDLDEAQRIWSDTLASPRGRGMPLVFCGPVWGKIEPDEVAAYILNHRLPWRLNVQVHKYIWNADTRKV